MALHPPRSLRRLSSKPHARQTLKLLLGCASMVVLAASVAFADFTNDGSRYGGTTGGGGTRAYTPPEPSRPSGSTGSNGTRGLDACERSSRGQLTALAPFSNVGQTTATHPTFVWYVPDVEPHSIELWLYKYDSNGKATSIGSIGSLQSQQGIMHYSLPPDHAGLTIGQTYRWQVTLICNPGSRSKDQVLKTDMAVVAMPATLQASLAKRSDHLQRARLYAKASFWYDALAETLATAKPPQTPPFVITLLEDLVTLEASGASDGAKQQHDRLKQVVEIEQR